MDERVLDTAKLGDASGTRAAYCRLSQQTHLDTGVGLLYHLPPLGMQQCIASRSASQNADRWGDGWAAIWWTDDVLVCKVCMYVCMYESAFVAPSLGRRRRATFVLARLMFITTPPPKPSTIPSLRHTHIYTHIRILCAHVCCRGTPRLPLQHRLLCLLVRYVWPSSQSSPRSPRSPCHPQRHSRSPKHPSPARMKLLLSR
jgi:hypothetical protein